MGTRYGLAIRAATSVDAPGLSEMLAAMGLTVPVRDLADRLDALRGDHGVALMALEWGPPAGLVVLHWYHSLLTASPIAEITLLHVGLDDRRRGIGRLLLKAAARAARQAGCETLRLCPSEEQGALRAFGAANGFTTASTCMERPLRKRD